MKSTIDTVIIGPNSVCSNGLDDISEIHHLNNLFDDGEEIKIEEYNPHDHGNNNDSTSYWHSVVHVMLVTASPTIMNIPKIFSNIGYVTGLVGTIAIFSVYAKCMKTIVDVEYLLCKTLRQPNISYPDTVYYSFLHGPRKIRKFATMAKNFLLLDLLIIWIGGNSASLLIACNYLKPIIQDSFHVNVTDRNLISWFTIPIILFCWIPNLRILAFCSAISNFLNFVCIFYIFFNSISNDISFANRQPIGSIADLPILLATILLTINGTAVLLTVKKEMKNPKQFTTLFGVLNFSYTLACILLLLFGLIVSLKYGLKTNENVLLNMPDDSLRKLLLILFALCAIFSYPLSAYVCYELLCNDLFNFSSRLQQNIFLKYACKTVNAFIPIIFIYLVPSIEVLISLAGAVGVPLDSIIFPALCDLLINYRNKAYSRKTKNYIFIMLGCCLFFLGIYYSATKIYYNLYELFP